MEGETQLGAFLRARRESVRPRDLGLPPVGRRGVRGLRREEVAMLAGISASYYARLEQGREVHPSEAVVEALGRALQLDDLDRERLGRLAAPAPPRRRVVRAERVRPTLRRLLDEHLAAPALVLGRHLDVLASNRLACAVHPSLRSGRNVVLDVFLDGGAREQYADPDAAAAAGVAALRRAAAEDPEDPRLARLVGELLLRSDDFGRLWTRGARPGRERTVDRFRHPLLGDLELRRECFAVAGTSGQRLVAYHAEPASPSGRALALLASLLAPPASGSGVPTRSDRRP